MTDSAIERLKNRQRKKVTTRNASLNQDNKKNIKVNNELDSSDSILQTPQSLDELNSNDSMPQTPQFAFSTDSEPVRRTIRLDPRVDAYMDTLCKKNKITKETLFEAAIIVCSNNQKTLNKAIADAQKRYSNRKRIGEMKKLETMNRKFQSL